MKVLYLDCFSGISGDMLVGAFCDLGVKPSALEWELSKLEIGDFHMHFERAQRQKIEGVHFSIHEGATHVHKDSEAHGHHHHEHEHEHEHEHRHEEHEHGHGQEIHAHAHHEREHDHHRHEHKASHSQTEASSAKLPHDNDSDHGNEVAHAHARHAEEHSHSHEHEHHEGCCGHHEHRHVHGRTHAEIRALIEASHLSEFVKKHALGIFKRIAVAEGKIHGMPPEDVHFHEVGALDSIADIVCSCVALESLGVERVLVSKLHEGRGWIDCAHGRFPLPAPATLEILSGIPIGETDETHELITPTGAAFIAEFASSSGPMPRMVIEKIGYGVGTRDLASRPNVLRAVIGTLAEE